MADSAVVLGLSWVDLGIVLFVLGVGLAGWRVGILRMLVMLGAVVVGVVLAGMYHERVFVDLAISEEPTGVMLAASFAVIVLLVTVGGAVAGAFLRGVAAVLLLGWADRAAGALFGVLFGLLLAQAALAIVVLAGLDGATGVIGGSELGWLMLDNVPVVRALLPAEFDAAIQGFVAEVSSLKEAVEEAAGPLTGS